MAEINLTGQVQCSPERVRALLLHEGFLSEFVRKQDPIEQRVVVDEHSRSATLTWVNDFRAEPLLKRAVGSKADFEMRVSVSDEVRLDLDARARSHGMLRSTMIIESGGRGSVITVVGTVTVSGVLGSMFAGQARDLVVKPTLEEELFPLLDQWRVEGEV